MEEDIPQHFLDQLDEAYRQLEEKDRDLMMAAQFGKQLLDAKEELEEQAENLKSQLADVTNKLGNERSQHSVVVRSFQEKESSNEATIASLTKQVQTWKEKSLSDALDRSGLSQAGAGSAGFSSNCDSDAQHMGPKKLQSRAYETWRPTWRRRSCVPKRHSETMR
eukprot:INCI4821.2.p1 GENE.INCI4821.2~~INCI4821.2.p1  ORF type:complete len:165 (+),score=31.29 INCI4821.2:194-688(+)